MRLVAKETETRAIGLKANPLVSKLLEAGSENAITLTGFIAPAAREGYVRLFPGLNNMSRSIEIAESDIIATVDLPKSGLGAIAIWVKRTAALHHHLIETAEFVRGPQAGRRTHERTTCRSANEGPSRGARHLHVRVLLRWDAVCSVHLPMFGSMTTAAPNVMITTTPAVAEVWSEALAFEAPYLIEKLVKDHVAESADEAKALFREVKRYLVLTAADRTVAWAMYSLRIDHIWHQFILFTRQYIDYCRNNFDRYIQHAPSTAPMLESMAALTPSTFGMFAERYEQVFGEPPTGTVVR